MRYKPMLAVDFDGVICENVWPEKGKPMPGVINALHLLSKKYRIIIWTCREKTHKDDMIKWLSEYEIKYDSINRMPIYSGWPEGVFKFIWQSLMDLNSQKVFADMYIDDRNFGGFPGWEIILKILLDK